MNPSSDSSSESKSKSDTKEPPQESMKNPVDKYFLDLEKWLNDAYMWQGVAASFPYFFMCNQYMSHYTSLNGNTTTNRNPFANEGSTFNNHGFVPNQNRPFISHGKTSVTQIPKDCKELT